VHIGKTRKPIVSLIKALVVR